MMKLDGSCHCGKVKFSLQSHSPYPYRWCYCTRCLKIHGGIGGVVSIMGEYETLEVTGMENVAVYTTFSNPPGPGIPPVELQMNNCKECGSHLFVYSPSWSDWVYPAASAIDTKLPIPPELYHINLAQKPDWVQVPSGDGHVHFDGVPEESIEAWHKRHGIYL